MEKMFSTEQLFSLDWKSVSSLVATILFLRSLIREFIPPEVSRFLKHWILKLFSSVQPKKVSILIDERDVYSNCNEVFDSVQAYLSSKCYSSVDVLKLQKPRNAKNLTFTLEPDQKIEDTFQDIPLKWTLRTQEKETGSRGGGVGSFQSHRFELSFERKHKPVIRSLYLPFVIDEATRIKYENRERKIYTNSVRGCSFDGRPWSMTPFSHPSNFNTLALDPKLKEDIMADLNKFVSRKEFYSGVGRAWKRGYLLFGPPGTGKTSLIAAIANFLEFDIYDLELTAVTSNSHLKRLLNETSSKSVLVVEDVDCTLDLSDRKKKETQKEEKKGEAGDEKEEEEKKKGSSISSVSLSGMLNSVDGLWSSCVGERLMIFTTNHKEKLDPALLRPGRMDKHIYLGFCEFKAFRILVKNYLHIDDHELMKEVEALLPRAEMTPADVAEILMSCNDDVELGMRNVVEEMKKKIELEGIDKEMVVTEEDPAVEEELEPKMKTEERVEEFNV